MIAPGAPKPPAATAAPAQSPGLPASAPQPQAQQQQQPGSVDQFMQLVRTHESGGNDKASSGVANGRYQFTPATWAGVAKEHPELGLQPQDIWDGAKQDLAMRAISKDYVNVLTMNGIQPSMPNMFMLHFLGTGGGPKFLKQMQANPNANAAALFPTEAQYNPTIFHDKGGQPRSLQQVYALMTKTFGGPAASMAGPAAGEMKAIDSFDKASGVPTAVRGFSDQMTASAGAQTSLEEVKLPPLLPGMKLDVSTKLPPLLPGMKLDYNSKEPLKQGAFTDKDGVYHPSVEEKKPDAPAPEVIGVDPTTGMPVFADPKLNAEEQQAETETAKGFAAGVAQDFTGPASLLPNPLGGYAEKANEYLDKTGDPAARVAGNIAPMLAPVGEVFGGIKAGAKAIEGATSFTQAMKAAALPAGKAAGTAGLTGALASSSNPIGKDGDTTMGERWAGKGLGMAESGLVGGLLGGGIPLAGAAGSALIGEGTRLGRIIYGAAGKEADKMAEELRTGVNAKTGEAISDQDRAAHIAALERFGEKAKLAKHEDDLKKITDAQAQLAERDQVRAAKGRDDRQATDPKALEKLREGVTARARERVYQAESQAKEAGATAEQAKGYAVEQEQKVLEAKNAAQEIATAFTKNPQMPKEEFGALVQKAADDLETKAEEAREAAADFKGAMKSAPPGPVVKNDGVMKALDQIEASSADRSVEAITNEVRKQVQTWARDEEGAWQIVDKSGLTVERADSLRKVLNTAMRSRTMAVEGGSADASAAQHHIRTVLRALEDATGEAHPPYNEAVKAWRDNSRGPLDEFLPKEALGKITKTQDFSGRFAMNEGRVVNEILNQSNAGSDALAVLARDNKEIVGATEKYLNRQLFGLDGRNVPTVKSVTSFMEKNEPTLRKLGLYGKYEGMRDKLASAGETVKTAETGAKTANDAAKKAEAQRIALEGIAGDRRSVLERSKKIQPGGVFTRLEEVSPKDVAKGADAKAAADAARLKEKAAGPKAARDETEANIKSLASEKTKAVTQKRDFEEFESSLKSIAPREVPAQAQSAVEALHKKGYITKIELDEANQKIAEIKQKYKEADWADRIRHMVIYPLASGAFGMLTGLSVHEYMSTRARAP